MRSVLQKRIQNYIDLNHLPVAAFEREAGLKANVARNILRGTSKRPTSDTLQNIANLMGCTIPELLGEEAKSSQKSLQQASSPTVTHPDLLIDSVQALLKTAQKTGQEITLQQVFSLTETTYNYALQKKEPQVDMDFVQWLVRGIIKTNSSKI